MRRVLFATIAVAMLFVGGHRAAAQSTRPKVQAVLPSVGLTFGETLRASFVNTGADTLTVEPCWLDPDGAIVKEQTLTLRAGQTGWVDISRSEVAGRGDRRVQLRLVVMLNKLSDAKDLMAGGEKIDELSGKTNTFVPPSFIFGGWNNHNETLVSDDESEERQ